ncbi:hypothetical protein V494_04677 [Pseudogymnoascus sp. VKM F-4513 (FW-928)]|nr:hypothetical protein V494_04677 [Pseudogymnoascus sp. VKM F-4513 (FW-928)]
MAPSPHSTRAAIINRTPPPNLIHAYSNRSAVMNQQTGSDKLGAYTTLSATTNQQAGSDKISAYDTPAVTMNQQTGSRKISSYGAQLAALEQQRQSGLAQLAAMDQQRGPGMACAYGTRSTTTDQQNASDNLGAYGTRSATTTQGTAGKLNAYEISSVTRKRFSDILHVGQHTITREDECLDPDCENFCKSIKDNSSKPELECSEDDFSLNMGSVVNAFGPFTLAPIPEHAASSNLSQAAGPSLRDLGPNANSTAISDPDLLVYPDLRKRVGRYFETRKPTPEGWTWSVADRHAPANQSYAPTQSTASVALTDSSTIASGSVTELSQAGTSRPGSPQMGLLQMVPIQMDSAQMDSAQMAMVPSQMALAPMDPLQMAVAKMGPSEMDNHTVGDEETLHPIAVISKMRELQTEGVVPFGPSRFLNHPSGLPSGNPNGNYLGTMSAASNQMASLPDHMNTCIWVEGAPADLTYFEMLRSIRDCGKVYSVHINPPREKHYTAAAKIAFCTRIGAERFFRQAHSLCGIVIRGRRICVRWNRNKYRENFNRAESRVLKISGDPKFVNYEVLGEYFARLFYFNLIWVEEVTPGVMIWEFSSILAQAHSAKQAIEREPAMMHIVRIKYERDPCE